MIMMMSWDLIPLSMNYFIVGLHQQLFLDRRPPFRLVGIDVLGAAPNAAFSIASINPVLRFTHLTSPARFSTYAGPTLEAIPDLFDDASEVAYFCSILVVFFSQLYLCFLCS